MCRAIFLLALTAVAAGVLSPAGPAAANPLTGVADVSAGGGHTCALTTAGGVKCWGQNNDGQLGDGTTTRRTTPVDVAGLGSGVAAVSAGSEHTCALTTIGGVKCWGQNSSGQLGHDTTVSQTSPADVSGLSTGVTAIAAGNMHTCALTSEGGVKCWGDNYFYGQLGDGTTTSRSTPVDVVGLSSGAVALTAGNGHTCALTEQGGVKCWGNNLYGLLGAEPTDLCGDPPTPCNPSPVDMAGLESGVVAVTAGGVHTCALTEAGGVKCIGSNIWGQLGAQTAETCSGYPCSTVLLDTTGLSSGVAAIGAGDGHTCALTEAGGVKCWGYDDAGQLGAAANSRCKSDVACSVIPLDVTGLSSGVVALDTGLEHTCAVTTGGGAKCWGSGYGQLGDGTTRPYSTTPVDVVAVSKIAAGDVNCNGSVNSIDATLVLQLAADLLNWISCFDAADVNNDGEINPIDAALILQFSAGLLHSLPP